MNEQNQLPGAPNATLNASNTQQIQPKRKFSWKSLGIGIAVVAIIALSTIFWLRNSNPQQIQQQTPLPPPVITSKPTTAPSINWQSYADTQLGYTIQYPPEFRPSPYFAPEPRPLIKGLSEGITLEYQEQSLTIAVGTISDYYSTFPLAKIVETGSLINSCYEDSPDLIEDITTNSEEKGKKAWYWLKKDCQGSTERIRTSPHFIFYNPATTTIVEISTVGMDDSADQIVSTFSFTK
jgi:hypothetical protein